MPGMRYGAAGTCALALALSLSGCATIFTGTHEDINVDSEPANASVIIQDQEGNQIHAGHTPDTFELKKPGIFDDVKKYNLVIKAPGYQEAKVSIRKDFNMWTLANICCGGILGAGIDFLDGAAFKLRPNEIHVTLHQAAPAAAPGGDGKVIIPGGASSRERTDDGKPRLYVVFYTRDDQGQLRMMSMPLVRETSVLASR